MSFLRNLFSRRAEPANAPATAVPSRAAAAPIRIPIPPPEPASPFSGPPPEDSVSFPLKAITDLFTAELQGALHKQPSEHVQVHIPRKLIRPQLAGGAVRITFAQLRAATPEIFFNPGGAPADAKVLLPLEIVLSQMTPPPRRDDQRQPAAPVNVPSIFTKAGLPRGNGTAAARGSADPWYSQRRFTYETAPEGEAKPGAAGPAIATAKKTFPPLAPVTERPRRDSEPPAAQPTPFTPPPPPPPPPPPDTFALPLSEVLAALPEEVRHALNGSDAKTAAFLIPLAEIETRLRTGKLLFKWAQLRCWSSVELAALAAPELEINLPLAAVVPLFMAARETEDPRKQIDVDTRIPDIFGKAKTVAPAAPPSPEPVKAAEPIPTPVPAPAAPAQLIDRLRSLEGVTGAFIATADGLLVAGSVRDANENVLAAFAPTVFAQLSKYADMAKLGLPESVDIHLAGGTMHVRKASKLYLGLLMPADRPLPLAELDLISNALKPHTT